MTFKEKGEKGKYERLKKQYCLNPGPEKVKDELFLTDEFFDPNDLMQVKYEMLRRAKQDKLSVSKASTDFGFSRVAFYKIQKSFNKGGFCGLIPKKRGPRTRHKVNEEIVDFCVKQLKVKESLSFLTLAKQVYKEFGIKVHSRSIRRALTGVKKNIKAP